MRQHIPTTRRHVLKPSQMRRFLAEVSSIGGGDMPDQVVGWSRKGKWTRMKATYPNGWELSVNFDRNGKVSSVGMAIRGIVQRVTGKAGAPIADSDGDDGA